MRFVDHDPAAARLAALRCREAADDLRRVASWLGMSPGRVAWSGGIRDVVVHDASEIARALSREAAAFVDSAVRLEVSAHSAARAEAVAWARERERQRAAAACQSAVVEVRAR